jgi:uncharacterized protein YuzE
MKGAQFNFAYDRGADVMYLFKGKPRRGKTAEISEDFILRLDPKTGEVTGLTIVDFSRHFPVFRSGARRRLPDRGKFSAQAFLAGVMGSTR